MIDLQFCVDVSSTMKRPYGVTGKSKLHAFNSALEEFLSAIKKRAREEESTYISVLRFGCEVRDVVKERTGSSFVGLEDVNPSSFGLEHFERAGTRLAEVIDASREICSTRPQASQQWVFLCTDGLVPPADHNKVLDSAMSFQTWVQEKPSVRKCVFLFISDGDPSDQQKARIQAFRGSGSYCRLDENWADIFTQIHRSVSQSITGSPPEIIVPETKFEIIQEEIGLD